MQRAERNGASVIALLLFGSGLTALVYQTAWQRLFRLVFGSSTAASAAVLGIFLGGLGLGGLWLGQRAERSSKPLTFYGNLEAAIAVLAALTPFTADLGARAYLALGGSSTLGIGLATLVRLLIAALVMGPAVVLMGGTLPAAARAYEHDGDASRNRLALLYATNTLGAVAGALLSTFVLFEVLGTRLTLWSSALLNLLIALVARSVGRYLEAPSHRVTEETPAAAPPAGTPATPPALVYGALGAVGFAFLSLELVWYRMLAPVLGGSTYTFGIILAVALFGIGLGGYLYSRRPSDRPVTLSLLGSTLVLEALAVGAPFVLGDTIALYAAYLRESASLGFGALVLSWMLTASVVVLPAAIVSGYQFPVLFALLGRGRERVARQVGVAYAFNTVGSIAGALVGGFLLLPYVGATGTWRAVVVLLAALGLAAFAYERRARRFDAPALATAALGAAGLLCAFAQGPSAVWRHSAIGAGRFANQSDKNELIAHLRGAQKRVLWERDGVETAVAVTNDYSLAFWVNGKNDGSVFGDRATQVMLGLATTALHPAPKSAFVIGLGTGMSAGWVAAVPGMERVDVAELEPALVELARSARQVNQDALSRPNLHLFLGDGREFLLTTRQRYDLVISEPSNPYRAGVASLFTQEFYEAAAERLNEGGYFAQWMQTYEVDVATIRSVIRTLRTVFPFVELWQTQSGDLLLLGSKRARTYDASLLRERLAAEPFASAMPRMWLSEGVEGLFAHFVGNTSLTEALGNALSPPLNTDDNTLLEYAFARRVGTDAGPIMEELFELSAHLEHDRPGVHGSVDWARVRELRGRTWMTNNRRAPSLPGVEPAQRARLEAIEKGCVGMHYDGAFAAWAPRPRAEQGQAAPSALAPSFELDLVETYVVGNSLAVAGDARALTVVEALAARGYAPESHVVHARFLIATKRPDAAADELVRSIAGLRSGSIPLCNAATEILSLLRHTVREAPNKAGDALEALLEGPFVVHLNEKMRRQFALEIAMQLPNPERCLAALGEDLTSPWWERSFLTQRMLCLERAGHPLFGSAQADLIRFLENTPGSPADGVPERTAATPAEARRGAPRDALTP